MWNPNRGEIWFCAIRLPNLGAATLTVASLDTAASLNATFYLSAATTSLDAAAYLSAAIASLDVTAPDPWRPTLRPDPDAWPPRALDASALRPRDVPLPPPQPHCSRLLPEVKILVIAHSFQCMIKTILSIITQG
jgi:hypothetical protein